MNFPLVSDYIPGVMSKLGNRTDIQSNGLAIKWIVEAVRNLTQNYPFVELQATGPVFTLSPGVYSYPLTDFINGDSIEKFGFFDMLWVWYNGAQGIGNPGFVMKYRVPAVVTAMAQTQSGGVPLYWSRYGQNILVGSTPNVTYYGFALYQFKHPFSVAGFDYTTCASDPVMLPSEWREVIEYAAAMKGAPEVNMAEMVPVWNELLYGNPEKRKPGIIAPLVSQFNRDASNNERQINVVV